jgi:mono/diheme cytochrome c family protein
MLGHVASLRALGVLAAFSIAIAGFSSGSARATQAADRGAGAPITFEPTPARLERGRYLVEGPAHCFGCHSEIDPESRPLRPIEGRKGGGRVSPPTPNTPFQLVIPNISSDRETGAGAWSDEQLARAIRQGIGHDGRTLYIRMPYRAFHSMSDEDLASVIVYLRTVPPVRSQLPKMALPPEVAAKLKPMPPPGRVAPPDASSAVARGNYLVRLSGCVGCHTPQRNGAPIAGLEFSGGAIFPASGGRTVASGNLTVASANLTSDPSGIPYYDEGLFVKTMRAGAVGGVRELDTVMPWSYYRLMTDDDLKDVFAFLKSLKPVLHRVCNTERPTYCSLCGGRHGYGDLNEAPAASH